MANVKITDLAAYTNPDSTDVLPIVDVGADVTKKVSIADLLENAGSGTESAPGIAFDGDSDTGIYRPGADQLAISTNGTGRLFIDENGNVGIKASDPEARLHITGTTAAGGIKIVDSSTSSPAPGIEVIGKRNDGNASTSFAGKLLLAKNRTDGPTLSTSKIGSVAFGGNHTDGAQANILYAASIHGEADGTFNSSTDMPTALVFNTGATGRDPDTANVVMGTERLRITSDGDVGIGISSPQAKLDVNGDIQITDGGLIISNGVFSAAGGAEDTPSIAFTGDLDTGIYRPGADQLAISTNGTERVEFGASEVAFNAGGNNYDFRIEGDTENNLFFVDASTDRIGINTNSPGNALSIRDGDISLTSGLNVANAGRSIRFFANSVDDTSNNFAEIKGGLSSSTTPQQGYLRLDTSGFERARIDSSGRLLVGMSSQSGGSLLQVNDDRIRIASSKTPASASDTGTAGEICWDSSYIYVAVGTNTWKRAALSSW